MMHPRIVNNPIVPRGVNLHGVSPAGLGQLRGLGLDCSNCDPNSGLPVNTTWWSYVPEYANCTLCYNTPSQWGHMYGQAGAAVATAAGTAATDLVAGVASGAIDQAASQGLGANSGLILAVIAGAIGLMMFAHR